VKFEKLRPEVKKAFKEELEGTRKKFSLWDKL
jgi:hypothetical protein